MQQGTRGGASIEMVEPHITIDPLGSDARRGAHTSGASRSPGLDVALAVAATRTGDGDARDALVRLCPAATVRVFLYVDGEEADAWECTPGGETVTPPAMTCQRRLPPLAAGRHAVTVRAVDATGTWGAASVIVAVGFPAGGRAERHRHGQGEAPAVRSASAS
jgi:hypothetical protein